MCVCVCVGKASLGELFICMSVWKLPISESVRENETSATSYPGCMGEKAKSNSFHYAILWILETLENSSYSLHASNSSLCYVQNIIRNEKHMGTMSPCLLSNIAPPPPTSSCLLENSTLSHPHFQRLGFSVTI